MEKVMVGLAAVIIVKKIKIIWGGEKRKTGPKKNSNPVGDKRKSNIKPTEDKGKLIIEPSKDIKKIINLSEKIKENTGKISSKGHKGGNPEILKNNKDSDGYTRIEINKTTDKLKEEEEGEALRKEIEEDKKKIESIKLNLENVLNKREKRPATINGRWVCKYDNGELTLNYGRTEVSFITSNIENINTYITDNAFNNIIIRKITINREGYDLTITKSNKGNYQYLFNLKSFIEALTNSSVFGNNFTSETLEINDKNDKIKASYISLSTGVVYNVRGDYIVRAVSNCSTLDKKDDICDPPYYKIHTGEYYNLENDKLVKLSPDDNYEKKLIELFDATVYSADDFDSADIRLGV